VPNLQNFGSTFQFRSAFQPQTIISAVDEHFLPPVSFDLTGCVNGQLSTNGH